MKDLICLSACLSGYVSEPLIANQEETADKTGSSSFGNIRQR
jgi:hypothetical protein